MLTVSFVSGVFTCAAGTVPSIIGTPTILSSELRTSFVQCRPYHTDEQLDIFTIRYVPQKSGRGTSLEDLLQLSDCIYAEYYASLSISDSHDRGRIA